MLTYNDFEGYVRTYVVRGGITDEVKILMIAMNLWQVVEADRKKVRDDVVRIITESKATFFVKDKDVAIDPDDVLYELRAEICTNVERYFYEKMK